MPQWGWAWVTADRLVSEDPCELSGAVLVADTGGAATADLYNGRGTGGRQVLRLAAVASEMGSFWPPVVLELDGGLYVDVGSNVVGVLVIWRPLM